MAFPGMRERCVKIGSAGKMFALTGWKVGFLCAAPPLTEVLAKAHQFLTFTTPPNLQSRRRLGPGNSDAWFAAMPADARRPRATGWPRRLRREGFAVLPSQGTYFLNVDLAASGVAEDDMDFCLRAVKEAGVAAIPVSAFYEEDAGRPPSSASASPSATRPWTRAPDASPAPETSVAERNLHRLYSAHARESGDERGMGNRYSDRLTSSTVKHSI